MDAAINIKVFDSAMEYFCFEVLPLYRERIAEHPWEGIREAMDDFLSNESTVQVGGEFISWENALRDMVFREEL